MDLELILLLVGALAGCLDKRGESVRSVSRSAIGGEQDQIIVFSRNFSVLWVGNLRKRVIAKLILVCRSGGGAVQPEGNPFPAAGNIASHSKQTKAEYE